MAALDKSGRRWRRAYISASLSATEAAAAAGLAVMALKGSLRAADMRALGPADGLPRLPAAEIAPNRTRRRRASAADAASRLGEFFVGRRRDGGA